MLTRPKELKRRWRRKLLVDWSAARDGGLVNWGCCWLGFGRL